MIWDRVAPLYDFFENTFNRAVYDGTGEAVARMIRPDDRVLECACGTGAISVAIAPVCARLVATDYSEGMLSQARKKLATHSNVTVEQADITALRYAADSFDVAVAGNVIHLLPDPAQALRELTRVVKLGGHDHRPHLREPRRWCEQPHSAAVVAPGGALSGALHPGLVPGVL